MWCGAQVVTLIRLKKISCVHVQYDCENTEGPGRKVMASRGYFRERGRIRGGVAGTVTYNLYISLLFELILNILSMQLF